MLNVVYLKEGFQITSKAPLIPYKNQGLASFKQR